MKTIILINGAKRSGKDFTASLLTEKLSGTLGATQTMSFATPLKQVVADTFGISMEYLEEFKNNHTEYDIKCMAYPNNQPSVNFLTTDFRTILQRFGTEGMKPIFGEAVWADITARDAQTAFSDGVEYVIVPDFRFYIESDTIKALKEVGINVVTLKIRNDDIDTSDAHASERELDDYVFDYTIDNTGYNPDLTNLVDEFITEQLPFGNTYVA